MYCSWLRPVLVFSPVLRHAFRVCVCAIHTVMESRSKLRWLVWALGAVAKHGAAWGPFLYQGRSLDQSKL